ncbi:hypothetical protein GCM10022224_006190 [Nonomuraea antimicrobica]|uniref:histidine kinase n=1 Tax=Nonomuraea antimicrobica TaxID=561173 RepID=A0ABP7B200_9ACTN
MTLFTGAVAALLSGLLATAVMLAIHRYATGNLTVELASAGSRVAQEVAYNDVTTPLVKHPDRNVQIVDARGHVIAATPALRGKPVMAGLIPDHKGLSTEVVCGGVFAPGSCNLVVAQQVYRAGEDWSVYSSSPTVPPYVMPWLAAAVIGTATALAAAITLLGHRIVTSSLRPVSAIRSELDQITDTCPERRVPLPPTQDEIHDLASTANRTLARLQAAMQQQRQFTTDASHELRTPIAAIRAEVEDALYAPADTSVSTLSNTVLRSVDRLEAIVGDLLTIERLEAGRPVEGEPIDLAAFVSEECERRPKPDKKYEYTLEPGVRVIGDRVKLSRLLTSLIDNAERHAATTITFHVRHEPRPKRDPGRFPHGIAVLEVTDDGPGIDPDKRELVFQRFSRLDTARDRHAGGTGLGLPTARQIAQAHGGTLQIDDSPAGARLVLHLPAAATPS